MPEWRRRRRMGLVLGQIISLCIAGTGVFSSQLAAAGVNIPTTQSFLNYALLGGFGCVLAVKNGGIRLQSPWWGYAVIAVLDVEANALAVMAYQYTSVTSVLLLDCFTIVCCMILSRIFLRASYLFTHLVGVFICFLGLLILVLSDVLEPPGEAGKDRLFGDALCLLASFLYACSNVAQEVAVKQSDRLTFLAMLGFFGAPVCGIQALVFDRSGVAAVNWTEDHGANIWMLFGFVATLHIMYHLTSLYLTLDDATFLNLSLLTSDVWGVIASVVLFHTPPPSLYFVAFFFILVGLWIYGYHPLPSALEQHRDCLVTIEPGFEESDMEGRCVVFSMPTAPT